KERKRRPGKKAHGHEPLPLVPMFVRQRGKGLGMGVPGIGSRKSRDGGPRIGGDGVSAIPLPGRLSSPSPGYGDSLPFATMGLPRWGGQDRVSPALGLETFAARSPLAGVARS